MYKRQQYHWLEEDEMLDLTAIAQSSPGPIAVNAAIIIGYRLAGMLGALVAIAGTVLPPLIILSVISLFYQAFRANQVVANVLRGMQDVYKRQELIWLMMFFQMAAGG